jgi:hypothetical protein
MKTKWFILLVSLALIVGGTGCTGTRDTRGGTPVYQECGANFMVPPSLIYPQEGSTISSLQPLFEWAYPGYYLFNDGQQQGKYLCFTPGFHLYLSSGPYFQDELGALPGGVPAFDSLYTRTWKPGTPLEPGREYRWSIRPISQGQEGPASEVRTFFTGPSCDALSLAAPIPLSPLNHWTVDDLAGFTLKWWYPGACLPDIYNVEMSTSLVLDGSPLNGSTATPTMQWAPVQALQDCTRYYWRVQAVKDGGTGPGSQVYTFFVNLTGTCPAQAYQSGSIQGTVWEDQCAGPGAGTPMPNQPPLGCVYPSPGNIFTNQSYDPGEPGIPGLVVSLGEGACPSSGYRDVGTWQDGTFDFYSLPPGTYCVSVDIKDPMNGPILLPGGWTYPLDAVGYALANQTVTVSPGQELKNVNFGWWYKYGTVWGSTNATVFGNVWHDLCAYAPGDPIPNPLPQGCVLDQWGFVHADAIRQVDEPGIPDVVVDIGPGDCPSAGLATAITDANGYYVFTDLPAGKYCLRIDPDHGSPNEAILLPGSWTFIPSGHEGMTFRAITLTANHTLPGQDFGWDFDNLPVAFTLSINAYCRYGPDIKYEAVDSALAGRSFPITGRSADGLWYYVEWSEISHCWLSASTGTASGNLSNLRVFYGPPLPPAAVPCSAHTTQSSCNADSICTWAFTSAGPGFCKSK